MMNKLVKVEKHQAYLAKISSNLQSHHLVMFPTVRIDCLGPILTKPGIDCVFKETHLFYRPVSNASANKPAGTKDGDNITRERRSSTSSSLQLRCIQLPWSDLIRKKY